LMRKPWIFGLEVGRLCTSCGSLELDGMGFIEVELC
jgi:hypothetical protein